MKTTEIKKDFVDMNQSEKNQLILNAQRRTTPTKSIFDMTDQELNEIDKFQTINRGFTDGDDIKTTKSVLSHKNGTPEGVNALAKSLEHNCPTLTFWQYNKMLQRANTYMELSNDLDWRHRWFMVGIRIMEAMSNPVIFLRA